MEIPAWLFEAVDSTIMLRIRYISLILMDIEHMRKLMYGTG